MNTTTKATAAQTFARLGKWRDVETKMTEARRVGVAVVHDEDAETVEATHAGRMVFRALHKGGGNWIVIYSAEFYPEQ